MSEKHTAHSKDLVRKNECEIPYFLYWLHLFLILLKYSWFTMLHLIAAIQKSGFVLYIYFFIVLSIMVFFFFFYVPSNSFFFFCSEFCHTLKWKGLGFTCLPHPEPYQRILNIVPWAIQFIHLINNSLHLLIPNSQSSPLLPPLSVGSHKSVLYICESVFGS